MGNTFMLFLLFIPLSIIALLIYLSTKSSRMVKYKVNEMAKSAVEFLHLEYKRILSGVFVDVQKIFAISDSFEKSKEMQESQKDEFAVGFAEWTYTNGRESIEKANEDGLKSTKELLEIYKKEGLWHN